jgi:hypothetical protein
VRSAQAGNDERTAERAVIDLGDPKTLAAVVSILTARRRRSSRYYRQGIYAGDLDSRVETLTVQEEEQPARFMRNEHGDIA